MPEQITVIFLNGKLPPLKIIRKYLLKNSYIICADGGANRIRAFKIIPKIILGDLDSIKKETKEYFRKKKTEIRKIDEQNTTDFEKSLLYCIENNLNNIIIFGAISTRSDHTLNNFSILKRYYKTLKLKIIDKKFEIFFIDKSVEFDYKVNKLISFLAFPFAKGVTTNGLKYPLQNEDLEFGVREGTLNLSESDKITINFLEGDLLLFKKHFL
ncbi:MAG TPA: thiamine diphosphokinase [Ignavibacteria bacterium]